MLKNWNTAHIEFVRLESISAWILGAQLKKFIIVSSVLRSILSLLDLMFLYFIAVYVTILSGGIEENKIPSLNHLENLSSNEIFTLIALTITSKNIGILLLQKHLLNVLAVREAEIGTVISRKAILENDDLSKFSNSANLMQTLNVSISALFNSIYKRIIPFVGDLTTLLAISIGLMVFNWQLATILLTFLLVSGSTLTFFIGRHQRIIGTEANSLGLVLTQSYSEMIQLKTELKLSGKHSNFIGRIHSHRERLSIIQSNGQFQAFLPRYLLEMLLICGIGLVVFYINNFDKSSSLLVALSLLVAAGYRLLPSLNSTIVAIASFQNAIPSLERIGKLGERFGIRNTKLTYHSTTKDLKYTHFSGDLIFDKVCYKFPHSQDDIYENFSFILSQNKTLLVQGSSGSGKTTLIGLATGILSPQSGKVVMRNQSTEISMSGLISGISYLQQDTPLLDESFGYNIAMRSVQSSDDMHLIQAAEAADIMNRIVNAPDYFATRIGENGLMLSAGERQRLGLARCLFSQPSILILDEPTANLDSDSESRIWKSLEALKGTMSILIVSHRDVPSEVFDYRIELKGRD